VTEDVHPLLHLGVPGHAPHDPLHDLLCQRVAVVINQDPGMSGVTGPAQPLCKT